MNLTLHFVLVALIFFSLTCVVAFSRNTRRAKRRHYRFFSFKGVRFKSAVHYLPMNGTTAKKQLVDMSGNVSAEAFNGVKTSTVEQLGAVLTLDGADDTIELRNFADTCIGDPTECTEGLSVAFWIRYTQGEFIISSGGYTAKNSGPGFRFICENCAKKGPHLQSSGKFLLELSTSQAKWKIHLDSIPCWWFHFAFTWNRNRGLKFYENGRLAVSNNNPVKVSGSGNPKDPFITIGKPNSLQSLFALNSYGNFSIAHLVIWTHELGTFDVEVAFLTVPEKTTKSMICCKQMKGDPCVEKPYHDGRHDCQQIADKFKCICSDTHTKDCSLTQKLSGKCEDQTPQCESLAKQKGFCEHRQHRMKEQCPRACNFCASQKRVTTTSPQNTLMTNPSPGSHNMQTPLSSREGPATTAVVSVTMQHTERKGISEGLLILIICVGCAGLVLMIIVIAFILTRFYKQRKGEFVPDKNYPSSHDKQNEETNTGDLENVSSIIDPSAPRITDVPHKPSRAQAAGGGGGGRKKQRKPMGVKVTYKPPEWD